MSGLTVCPLYFGWVAKEKEKKRRGRGEESRAERGEQSFYRARRQQK